MKLKDQLRPLWYVGFQYWLAIICLVMIGISIGGWLSQRETGIKISYKIYQSLRQFTQTPQLPAKNTVIVLVGDEEYWKDRLGGRVPIKRDYLADIIRALDNANPSAIAVDFNLRSPTPNGSIVVHSDYEEETNDFLNTVRNISERTPIILPKTIAISQGNYISESDIYDGFDFRGGKVTTGYIALPFDNRSIPLDLTLKDGTEIHSFAQAVINAAYSDKSSLLRDSQDKWIAYRDFIDPENFPQLSAREVLSADPKILESKIANKIVIIGGVWSSRAYGTGPQVDLHPTSIGNIPGVFIHANYVETLLESRAYTPINLKFLRLVNILLILTIAIILTLKKRPLFKLVFAMNLCIIWVLYILISVQTTVIFFEFVVSLLLVTLNIVLWTIFNWRLEARRHQLVLSEQLPLFPAQLSQAEHKLKITKNRIKRLWSTNVSLRTTIYLSETAIAFYLLISAFSSFLILRFITNREITIALGTVIGSIIGMRLLVIFYKAKQLSRYANESLDPNTANSLEAEQ